MNASWWSRVGATLLDGLIVAIPFVVLFGVAAAADAPAVGVVAYLLWFVVSLFYAPVLLARSGEKNGQTWGKQALGIRVVADDGAPIGFGKAALREILGKSVFGTLTGGIYSILDSLWPVWDGRNQALHDKLGKTTVERVQAPAEQPQEPVAA